MTDEINPSHYKSSHESKQVWEMMFDCFGKEKFLAFCELNAFKYRMRAGKKPTSDASDDIKKALWYETRIEEMRTVYYDSDDTRTTTPQ
jgi:hypothetical protein